MRKILSATVLGGALASAFFVQSPAESADTLRKPAYAKWDNSVVNIYVDPSAKKSQWNIGRSVRAWSKGPLAIKIVGSAESADITISEIPMSRKFQGNAHFVHIEGVFESCDIELADNTRSGKRAHVASHEIGHCLGLPHVSEYSSVMDSWTRGDHPIPTDMDIDWLRFAYEG